jgi:hypothetical protein
MTAPKPAVAELLSLNKILGLVCAAGLTAASGCAFDRGRHQADHRLSPQAQDEQPHYIDHGVLDHGVFPENPDYPQNR